jgi:hypothetical protein
MLPLEAQPGRRTGAEQFPDCLFEMFGGTAQVARPIDSVLQDAPPLPCRLAGSRFAASRGIAVRFHERLPDRQMDQG